MTTLLIFSGTEGQMSLALSNLPSQRGAGVTLTPLLLSQEEGGKDHGLPLFHPARRGMGVAMATLLTFVGIEGSRSLPLAHLPF